MVIASPTLTASQALVTRLMITCLNLSRSTDIITGDRIATKLSSLPIATGAICKVVKISVMKLFSSSSDRSSVCGLE